MTLSALQAIDMRVAESTGELRAMLDAFRLESGVGKRKSVALVPTMGCLHAGHARLIREARTLANTVVVSIYVNPLQFGPHEDFARYPRSLDADLAVCAEQGADIVFHPATLYPEDGPKVSLTVRGLSDVLCGAVRPGHFDGVATVVAILFNTVQPNIAVFGEKDWQQLAIIRRMVADLHMPVDIVGVETVREADGLAMSSRNRYLDEDDRKQAAALSRALDAMGRLAGAGERDVSVLLDAGRQLLQKAGIEPEYLEIRDAQRLTPMDALDGRGVARSFVAARVGGARLIDNMPLEAV
jgi:pantoate--beta-alanine ligase